MVQGADAITRGQRLTAAVAGILVACGAGAVEERASAPRSRPPAVATAAKVTIDAGTRVADAEVTVADAETAAVAEPADAAIAAPPDAAPANTREILAFTWCGRDGDSDFGGGLEDHWGGGVGRGIGGRSPHPVTQVDVRLLSSPPALPCAADVCGLREDARECASQTRMNAPGSVFLSIPIAPDGSVGDVRAAGPARVTECIRAAAANARLSCAPTGAARPVVGLRIDLVPPVSPAPPGPTVRESGLVANGRLRVEVISRIVRVNRGRFLHCYEAGLAQNPALRGRVGVRFVIGKDGNVMFTTDGGSDLPDAGVCGCVQSVFRSLSFPAPDSGTVMVSDFFTFGRPD